jgi:hypothetical protein
MSEKGVWIKVTRVMGHEPDKDAWSAAVGEGLVEDADIDPVGFQPKLVERLRELESRLKGEQRRRKTEGSRTDSSRRDQPLFTPEEQLRAHALYEFFAKLATADSLVREYRAAVLSDQLLEHAAACDFLTSALTQWFPLPLFIKHGVSPVRHTYRVVLSGTVEQDGRKLDRITVDVQGVDAPWTYQRTTAARGRMSTLAYPGPDGWVARVRVNHDSVLDDLGIVARHLSSRFPWEEYQATWFVLTGAIPLWWPVRRSIRRTWDENFEYHAVTLTVEPWASASTVLKLYRAAQRQMLDGRENRPISGMKLELFRFCNGRMADEGKTDWPRLAREWNEAHSAERVRDTRALKRKFDDVRRQLAFPSYAEPW